MNHVLDALDQVLSWELSDDFTADALTTQACLLAGCCPEDLGVSDLD